MTGGAGCSTGTGLLHRSASPVPMPDMDAFLPKFDQVVAATREPDFTARHFPLDLSAFDEQRLARWHQEEPLVRQSVRTLFVTGTFLDLPEAAQMHPGLQERMVAYMPELDDTVYAVSDHLSELSDERRRYLQRELRADPDLPLNVAASINKLATMTRLSPRRRAQVRSTMTQAGWRLREQNPSLIIDEYVDKVERFAPREATDADLLRRYQALIGQNAIRHAQIHASTQYTGTPSSSAVGQEVPVATQGSGHAGPTPGERNRRRGGKAMGLGLLVFAGGAVVVAIGSAAGLFLMTAGFFMVSIGLITFLAGAVQG